MYLALGAQVLAGPIRFLYWYVSAVRFPLDQVMLLVVRFEVP